MSIYRDIAARTNGAVMIGVVGPVRTGKSTFIKSFMELAVIPNIEDEYRRERAIDELPQSGSGRTIMTSEPKFVPEDAVKLSLDDTGEISVRLIDCVGYMVRGATGQFDDGGERMVTTPWFDHEVTMSEAAESGTYKVIAEHSTVGLVITTDGSICGIEREDYIEAEERTVRELKAIGKPFCVLLNSAEPRSEAAQTLCAELNAKYGVSCMCLNCKTMGENELNGVLRSVLNEFELEELSIALPDWLRALEPDCELKSKLYESILNGAEGADKIRDIPAIMDGMSACESVDSTELLREDFGTGCVELRLNVPRRLYFKLLSEECGLEIRDDGAIMSLLREMSGIKQDYDRIKTALHDVRTKGYGVVMPTGDELQLEEPQIVKHSGHYTVRLKAQAPAIHMLKTNVVTEVSPALGGENASEQIVSFLLQGYEGDMTKLWQSNIFGRSLYEIAEEGIASKLAALPENARGKLQETLQKIINDGSGMLICILL